MLSGRDFVSFEGAYACEAYLPKLFLCILDSEGAEEVEEVVVGWRTLTERMQ